ncbi:MAG: hypothetical protein J6H20_02440 [Pyramidobacter sp.]|nr:hypothetical protein [Pyramidobacter sp.]
MSEQKKYDKQYFLDLAARIYDLDVDVYETLGSSLGRVFGADRDRCVAELASLMRDVKGESGAQLAGADRQHGPNAARR